MKKRNKIQYFWKEVLWSKDEDILKILEHTKDKEKADEEQNLVDRFNKMTISDILYLKKKWVDLAKFLLVWTKDHTKKAISSSEMKAWDIFTINFWKNKDLKNFLWAWDILKWINKIKVFDNSWGEIVWSFDYSPRPWFYKISKKWKKIYVPIYDWYKIY